MQRLTSAKKDLIISIESCYCKQINQNFDKRISNNHANENV